MNLLQNIPTISYSILLFMVPVDYFAYVQFIVIIVAFEKKHLELANPINGLNFTINIFHLQFG